MAGPFGPPSDDCGSVVSEEWSSAGDSDAAGIGVLVEFNPKRRSNWLGRQYFTHPVRDHGGLGLVSYYECSPQRLVDEVQQPFDCSRVRRVGHNGPKVAG